DGEGAGGAETAVAGSVALLGLDGVGAVAQVRGVHRPTAAAGGGGQCLDERAGGVAARVDPDRDRGRVAVGGAGVAAERRRGIVGDAAISRTVLAYTSRCRSDGEGGGGAEAAVAGGIALLCLGGVGAVTQGRGIHRPGAAAGGGGQCL